MVRFGLPNDLSRQRSTRSAKTRFMRASVLCAGILGLAAAIATPGLAQTISTEKAAQVQPMKPAPAPSAGTAQKGATPATVLDDKDVETVLGREIYSSTGEDMGRIVDIL